MASKVLERRLDHIFLRTIRFKPKISDRDVWMRKKFIPLPQELNNSVGSGTGTDTTALRLAPNPINSAPTSGTPYYKYICTWVDYLLTVLHDAKAIMLEIGFL